MSTEMIATLLLVLRVAASIYLYKVQVTQRSLLNRPIEVDKQSYTKEDIKKIWNFRRTLYLTTLALFIGNFIPITLDSTVIFQSFGLFLNINTETVLIVYALSNAITGLLAAYLIFSMYRLATSTKEVTDLELKHLRKKD